MADSIEHTVRLLKDKADIMEMVYAWMAAQDRRDWEGLRKFLVADSTFNSPRFGPQVGPDKILANIERALGHIDATLHVATDEVVSVDGDAATASFYVCAHHHRAAAEGGAWFTNRNLHTYSFVRTDAGWKLKETRPKALWGEGNPAVRTRQEDAATHVKS